MKNIKSFQSLIISLLKSSVIIFFLLLQVLGLNAIASDTPAIKRIYIMHYSHQDVGFTDMPGVCREMQKRYIDIALDAILTSMNGPAEKKFYWTCESLLAVDDWWQTAMPERQAAFLKAVRSGQLEVAALPFNQTPFLDAGQWKTMMQWIPEELWQQIKPQVAIQNDVTGFPRSGALHLLDKGINNLCTGINSDEGGPPFFRPSAFWWKMPDGRRLFVYINLSYPDGYDFFENTHWRRGPVPSASDTRYRPPHEGDFFRTDEASLRAAHEQCLKKIEQLRKKGYQYDELTVSITNHWRMDNDPPFLPLADFVAAWNKLGLKPELVLTTASKGVEAMKRVMGPTAPEYTGEFTDWWAKGTASAPREVAASRYAKRLLSAVQSPLWGPMTDKIENTVHTLYKDLCLFDEHTWGSGSSIALPWSFDSQAQFSEKSMLAWRPMGMAELLLSQRARTRLTEEGEGLFVANPCPSEYTGWVELPVNCLRGNYRSLTNTSDNNKLLVIYENGLAPWTRPGSPEEITRENTSALFPDNKPNQSARFWVEKLPANSYVKYRLEEDSVPIPHNKAEFTLQVDSDGWPVSAKWDGMSQPLFVNGIGDFSAVKVDAFSPYWALKDISNAKDDSVRDQLRSERIEIVPATAERNVEVEETPYTIIYTQWLKHPRLLWIKRSLEIWRNEPRARLTLRLNRLSSEAPEIFYVGFNMPCKDVLPTISSGGKAFIPFVDQIPGTCRDHFAFDGWADYATKNGHWIWGSRDAPLLSFEKPQVWTRTQSVPEHPERILAMVFNNTYYTNFVSNETGVMEFQFDLIWKENIGQQSPSSIYEGLVGKPVVLINGKGDVNPIVMKRLFLH